MGDKFYSVGFDVSFRTGWSVLEFDSNYNYRYKTGGIVASKSTVVHRCKVYEEILGSIVGDAFKEDVCIGIEQPLPGAGNQLYTIEAAKRIGEVRMLAYKMGFTKYTENHPSQMRSFVLNARFKGKEPIMAFVNEYMRGKSDRMILDDEADACVHAMLTAAAMGWMQFPEVWRMGIIDRIKRAPLQLTDWR